MLASTFREMGRLALAGWRRMLVAVAFTIGATSAIVLVLFASISSAWRSAMVTQRGAMDAAMAAGTPDEAVAMGDVLRTFSDVLVLGTVGLLLISCVALAGAAMVVRAGIVPGESLADCVRAGVRLLPWTSSQAGIALAPPLVVIALAMVAAQVHPLLAIPVVMLSYAVMFACTPWMLLALAGSSLGDRDWVPRESWRLVRARPLPILGVTFVGLMAVGAVTCVLVVPGGVLLLGPAPLVASGVGILIAVQALPPMLLAAALYRAVGGEHTGDPSQPAASGGAFERAAVHGARVEVAADLPVEHLLESQAPSAPEARWEERFESLIDTQSAWGVWVETSAAGVDVVLQLAWSAGTSAPRLLVADAAGAWFEPVQPTQSQPIVRLRLPGPRAYLHLESRGEPQQVVVELAHGAPAARAS